MKIKQLLIITFFVFLLAPKSGWAISCNPNDISNPNPASVSVSKTDDSTVGWYLYEFTVTNNLDTSCTGYDIVELYVNYPSEPTFKNLELPSVGLPSDWEGTDSNTWLNYTTDYIETSFAGSNMTDPDMTPDSGDETFNNPITPQNFLGGFIFKLDKDNGCASCNPFNFEYEIGFVGPSQATYKVILSSTTVPEPTSLILLGLGIASISLCGRFRFSRRKKL